MSFSDIAMTWQLHDGEGIDVLIQSMQDELQRQSGGHWKTYGLTKIVEARADLHKYGLGRMVDEFEALSVALQSDHERAPPPAPKPSHDGHPLRAREAEAERLASALARRRGDRK